MEVRRADVTGDGVPDAAVFVRQSTPFGVHHLLRVYDGADGRTLYTITRLAPRSLDLDGDGMVDASDLALLVGAIGDQNAGDSDGALFDLNGDGAVDVHDVVILLDSFGDNAPEGGGPCPGVDCGPDMVPCSDCTCSTPCQGDGTGTFPGDDDGDGDDPRGGGGGGGNTNPPPDDDDEPNGSCSVEIVPAVGHESLPKCVGVWTPDDGDDDETNDTDDLPTVRAEGSDAEGAYSWEVVQGLGRILLVDADTGEAAFGRPVLSQSVRFVGVAPSDALNDVVIKVTHTTADGSCEESDMIELTVILATLTFRPANPQSNPPELWSANNSLDPQFFAVVGAPQLGPVSWDSPLGTRGYFKNIEIEAKITPCIDGLASEFDFKRVRQGYDANVAMLNGQFWTTSSEVVAPSAWQDDDMNNNDEDLQLDLPPDCTLYVIDSPGVVLASQQCGQTLQNAQVHQLQCLNFREWLAADGFRASATKEWYATTEIVCAPNGVWLPANNFNGNTMGPGLHACPPLPPSPSVQNQSTTPSGQSVLAAHHVSIESVDASSAPLDAPMSSLLERVQSRDFIIRDQAMGELRKIVKAGTMSPTERKTLIQSLIHILRAPAGVDRGTISHPHLIAIEMLGRLRASESIPTLIEHVDKGFTRQAGRDIDLLGPPAAIALFRVGEPAVAPILERVGTASESQWRAMRGALSGIDQRFPLVRQVMETILHSQALLPPPADEDETAERELIEKRLAEFLATPEPKRELPEPNQTAMSTLPQSP